MCAAVDKILTDVARRAELLVTRAGAVFAIIACPSVTSRSSAKNG